MDSQQIFKPHGAPVYQAKFLPVQPPGQIIGRNRELASMHVTTKAGSAVFLSGPSGIGKTTLAAVLATAYIASNPGGVLWLRVPEDDLRQLIARVGRAYGLDTYAEGDMPRHAATVRELLAKNRPLLVLDGLIDLNAARDFVRLCATGIPTILVNEQPGAGPWTPITLEPLSEADSRSLFRYYSGLNNPLYNPDIEGLCRFLDGYPMAIELAARQVAVDDMTPAELMTMLPATGGRGGQQAILAIVFKRLEAAVQGMLLVLSTAFDGTATAELISELSNVPPARVIPLMRQLVMRGLAHESIVYGQAAYTLHEVAQRYALDWLRIYHRLQSLEKRVIQVVLAYTERHAQDTQEHHERLAAEIGNILGAAAYATAHEQAEPLEQLVRLLEEAAGSFIGSRGFGPELAQIKKLRSLLKPEYADRPASIPDFSTTVQEAMPPPPAPPAPVAPESTPEAPGDTLVGEKTQPAAMFSQDTQAGTGTKPVAPVSLAATQPAALPGEDQPETLPAEATERAALGAFAAPEAAAEQAEPTQPSEPPHTAEDTQQPTLYSLPSLQAQLEEARAGGDAERQAPLLQTIGSYYAEQGEAARAAEHLGQALDLYETLGNRDGMAATLEALADLAAQSEDHTRALEYAGRGVEVAAQTGDTRRLGRLQLALADAQGASGAPSVETYARAIETLRTTEDWPLIGLALYKLGAAYLAEAQPQEAILILEQALVIFRRESLHDQEAHALMRIGEAHSGQHQWPEAKATLERALFLARECFDRRAEAHCLAALGHAMQMQSNSIGAIQYYRQALHLAYLLDDAALQAEYARSLGALLLEDARTLSQSVQLLREASELNPEDDEVRRLLNRADKRWERMQASGAELPPAEGTNRDYAAQAYVI